MVSCSGFGQIDFQLLKKKQILLYLDPLERQKRLINVKFF